MLTSGWANLIVAVVRSAVDDSRHPSQVSYSAICDTCFHYRLEKKTNLYRRWLLADAQEFGFDLVDIPDENLYPMLCRCSGERFGRCDRRKKALTRELYGFIHSQWVLFLLSACSRDDIDIDADRLFEKSGVAEAIEKRSRRLQVDLSEVLLGDE